LNPRILEYSNPIFVLNNPRKFIKERQKRDREEVLASRPDVNIQKN